MGQKNSFLEIEDFLLYHDIDTFSGQSGSAVFRGADSMIVGVHTNGSPTYNIAQRVDPEMLDFLNSGCADNGCTISSYTEPTGPPPPNPDDAFWRTWARTDKPVKDGHVIRTWMWGPQPYTGLMQEPYDGGMRTVQYYDKSRMEINDPSGDPTSPWYVTNGLLSLEMVVGKTETAPGVFDQSPNPAQVGVAGDSNDSQGPTYATFTSLLKAPMLPGGSVVTQRVNRAGSVTNDGNLASYGVTALNVSPEVGSWVDFSQHAIASVFWEFMNSQGLVEVNGQLVTDKLFSDPFYGTGLAITEPYWSTVQVGGTPKEVLVQCFERRCLTYTPSNDPTWRVEAGNVGQHYHTWRYDQPSNGVPTDQDPLYAWNIANWSPYQDDHTTITPTGNALHFRTDTDVPIFGWWDVPTGDYSVSADVRLIDAGTGLESTFACITARLAADYSSNYVLCIYADGWISAGYEYFDESGYHFDALVENGFLDSAGPVSDWNTLKIVVKGDTIWFLVNGTLIGSATHAGPLSGVPSMYIVSLDGAWVEWAFTNFNVQSLK